MNVFTGLAVGDVANVMKTAKNKKMLSQLAFLVNYMQRDNLIIRESIKTVTYTITEKKSGFGIFLNGLQKYFGSSESPLEYSRKRILRWLSERTVEIIDVQDQINEKLNKIIDLNLKIFNLLNEKLN